MGNELQKVAKLDHRADTYLLYVEKRKALKELQKEVDKLEREIRAEVGDAEAATILDEVVLTNEPTKTFRTAQFAADNPMLFKEFTHPVLKDEFDVDEFRARHPALYAQYQSRQFRPKLDV